MRHIKNKLPQNWSRLLTHLIYSPGESEEDSLSKNIYFGIASSTFILGIIALAVYWCLDLMSLVYLMAGFCAFFVVTVLLFLRSRKHAEQFFVGTEVFKILFGFAAVLITGGILRSGGFVFIGFGGIYFALVFPDLRKVRFLLILYLVTVTMEALLQPYVTPLVQFSETENLTLFVLYFILTVITLYFFIRIYTKERMRFRQLEAEKLRALDAARSHFFTNISHEFRTPLTVILGTAEQIRETAAKTTGSAARLIQRNGKKLLRLVDQLLDLSKLEAGHLSANYVQGDVVTELRYVLESYHSLAEAKNIRLHFSSNEDEIQMDFDPEKLEHLAGNLLDNAVKYTPGGGEVWLQIERLPTVPSYIPTRLEPGTCLLLRVKDTGIGIPPQHLGRIFDRFYQVGEWPTEGSGIGLAMVREYVRLFGG
ncbi:MAG: HAMP domain-containing sensor histidine kinase, partial [Bacteroidota bacterium]